ncbi:hypothetical protein pipiens_006043 [Culex pipiens pipiens]|uniref:C2H2-type domain-containing protein n=1 Tax=Culex pipiens pipiens TaxID=38569 RepID=A0ABD1DSG8_CULPP
MDSPIGSSRSRRQPLGQGQLELILLLADQHRDEGARFPAQLVRESQTRLPGCRGVEDIRELLQEARLELAPLGLQLVSHNSCEVIDSEDTESNTRQHEVLPFSQILSVDTLKLSNPAVKFGRKTPIPCQFIFRDNLLYNFIMNSFDIGAEDEFWLTWDKATAGTVLKVVKLTNVTMKGQLDVHFHQLLFLVEVQGDWVEVRTIDHRYMVGMVPIAQVEISRTSSPGGILAADDVFICNRCNYRHPVKANVVSHRNEQKNCEIRFLCGKCCRSFLRRSGRDNHEKRGTCSSFPRQYSCDKCFQVFETKISYSSHIRHSLAETSRCNEIFRGIEMAYKELNRDDLDRASSLGISLYVKKEDWTKMYAEPAAGIATGGDEGVNAVAGCSYTNTHPAPAADLTNGEVKRTARQDTNRRSSEGGGEGGTGSNNITDEMAHLCKLVSADDQAVDLEVDPTTPQDTNADLTNGEAKPTAR